MNKNVDLEREAYFCDSVVWFDFSSLQRWCCFSCTWSMPLACMTAVSHANFKHWSYISLNSFWLSSKIYAYKITYALPFAADILSPIYSLHTISFILYLIHTYAQYFFTAVSQNLGKFGFFVVYHYKVYWEGHHTGGTIQWTSWGGFSTVIIRHT